jgi:hypothetical protein
MIPDFEHTTDADVWAEVVNSLAQINECMAVLDHYTWHDLGEHMTCTEANAMNTILELLGHTESATGLRTGHANGDVAPEDQHYGGW